jgi:molybdopterin/thiamine biosynthesis adenylyltransferase
MEADTVSSSLSRQSDIIDPSIGDTSVAILGLGTAGSWSAILVSKLGVKSLDVWDDDTVELGNLGCQLYGRGHLEQSKAEALGGILSQFVEGPIGRTQLTIHADRFGKVRSHPPDVVVSCLDNWQGRRDALKWAQRGSRLFIEARMAARYRIVHAIDPSNVADVEWLAETFGDDGGPEIPCGLRGTAFLGASVGAEVAALIVNLVNGEPIPRDSSYHLGVHQVINLD